MNEILVEYYLLKVFHINVTIILTFSIVMPTYYRSIHGEFPSADTRGIKFITSGLKDICTAEQLEKMPIVVNLFRNVAATSGWSVGEGVDAILIPSVIAKAKVTRILFSTLLLGYTLVDENDIPIATDKTVDKIGDARNSPWCLIDSDGNAGAKVWVRSALYSAIRQTEAQAARVTHPALTLRASTRIRLREETREETIADGLAPKRIRQSSDPAPIAEICEPFTEALGTTVEPKSEQVQVLDKRSVPNSLKVLADFGRVFKSYRPTSC